LTNIILVPGIGHRIKSRNNPDLRVELVKEFVKNNFPSTKLLDYALAVEEVTTSKKDNLILNVDGCIAVCFVDLIRNCGAFTPEEAEEYLTMGVLNGLFVLGRSIGLIAHFLDQKRLRTGLYRHPWEVRLLILMIAYCILNSYRILPTSFHNSATSPEPVEVKAESRLIFKCISIGENRLLMNVSYNEMLWGCNSCCKNVSGKNMRERIIRRFCHKVKSILFSLYHSNRS
jgi:hypothetical protein